MFTSTRKHVVNANGTASDHNISALKHFGTESELPVLKVKDVSNSNFLM